MPAFNVNAESGRRTDSNIFGSRYDAMGARAIDEATFQINRRTDTVSTDGAGRVLRTCSGCHLALPLTPENFRWQRTFRPNPRYMTRCRECERAAGAARRSGISPDATATGRAIRQDRSFGVELEVNCDMRRLRTEVEARGLSGWQVRMDGSLGGRGCELVSPPLRGAEGFEQLRKACEALTAAGATVDRACGLHVHVDLNGLSANAVRRTVKAYVASQEIIDGLLSESRRADRNMYCRRWYATEIEALDQCRDISGMSAVQDGRYKTVNLKAYPRHGTIEFRQHQGTTSFRKVEAWVKFVTALVASTVRSEINRASNVAELMTSFGADEDTAAFLIGRAVQFNAVPVSGTAV